jgi:hypothetical protein
VAPAIKWTASVTGQPVFARGGQAVIPDTPHQPVQHIDVRDLAAWIVTAAEQRLAGTYDAVGPVLELGPVLHETAKLVGAADLELVPIDPDTLIKAGINPWGGPRSLPLWLPVDKKPNFDTTGPALPNRRCSISTPLLPPEMLRIGVHSKSTL